MTVLIYKTKMVTVNYVFLCAFLKKTNKKQKNDKKKISGKGCWDVEAADVHVRERETFFSGGV